MFQFRTRGQQETLAALSSDFHTNKRFQKYVAQCGERVEGMFGTWQGIICAAAAFCLAEKERKVQWGQDEYGEWIETLWHYIEFLFDDLREHGNWPNEKEAKIIALKALDFGKQCQSHMAAGRGEGVIGWSITPGKLPAARRKQQFALQLDDGRAEDGTFTWLLTDGSWTTKDRGDLDDVRFFETADAAVEHVGTLTFGKRDKVYTTEFDEQWNVGEVKQVKPLKRN